jgi:outer membrane immunogenic protein
MPATPGNRQDCGASGDFAWADATATAAGIPGCAIECFPGAPGPASTRRQCRCDGTRARAADSAFCSRPPALRHRRRRLAGRRTSGTCLQPPDPACLRPGNPFDTRTNSKTLTGGTVGGGLETIYGNWLLRAEYRYAWFGKLDGVFDFQAAGVPAGADTSRYNLSVDTHVATVGLAYKFGAPVYGSY